MADTFVDFKKYLAPIFRILIANLLKKEPFSSSVKPYDYKRSFSRLKQWIVKPTRVTRDANFAIRLRFKLFRSFILPLFSPKPSLTHV